MFILEWWRFLQKTCVVSSHKAVQYIKSSQFKHQLKEKCTSFNSFSAWSWTRFSSSLWLDTRPISFLSCSCLIRVIYKMDIVKVPIINWNYHAQLIVISCRHSFEYKNNTRAICASGSLLVPRPHSKTTIWRQGKTLLFPFESLHFIH